MGGPTRIFQAQDKCTLTGAITIALMIAISGFLARSWFVDVQNTQAELREHELKSAQQWEKFIAADNLQIEHYDTITKRLDRIELKIDKLAEARKF